MMFKKVLFLTVLVFLFIGWSNDPYVNTSVCRAVGSQECACMVSDGFGGAVIAWEDHRMGNCDLFVQRVDSLGKTRWKKDGIAVCTFNREQSCIQLAGDGTGGAFLVWQDERNPGNFNIFAQRIDGQGKTMWQAGGVPICRAVKDQKSPRVVSDSAGGVIIAWLDYRNGSDVDIYAQRVDATGAVLWAAGGVPVCTEADNQLQLNMTAEQLGGAVLTWTDNRSGKEEIYTQRINNTGAGQWTGDGVKVSASEDPAYNPQISPAGKGCAIITWLEKSYYYGYEKYKVFAQRIDRAGNPHWGAGGLYMETEYGYEPTTLQVIPDGTLGAFVSWTDHDCPSQKTVEMEHVDASGVIRWHRIASYYYGNYGQKTISDGSGGLIVSWLDEGYYGEINIYAQHFDVDGNNVWAYYGVTVSAGTGTKAGIQMVSDDAGGAVVSWTDGNIFAQNLCDSGGLGDCVYPVARINRFRYGGIIPVKVNFDGSGSFDPDGNVSTWLWDFGDGQTGSGKEVAHTYTDTGVYWVNLRVRDNSDRWSAEEKAVVMTYTFDQLEAKIETTSQVVKARGKGLVEVSGALYETETDPGRVERPVPVSLGLDYTTNSGTWQEEMIFAEGLYTRTLVSGEPGTAEIKAVIKGTVMTTTTVDFTWPQPPVNVKVDVRENRSLFRGEYYMHITWSKNPGELYTPAHYRIYRSVEGGSMTLLGDVDADTFAFSDRGLPVGKQYTYAVTMVDSHGDESDISALVTAIK